jgi:hypothetical protein
MVCVDGCGAAKEGRLHYTGLQSINTRDYTQRTRLRGVPEKATPALRTVLREFPPQQAVRHQLRNGPRAAVVYPSRCLSASEDGSDETEARRNRLANSARHQERDQICFYSLTRTRSPLSSSHPGEVHNGEHRNQGCYLQRVQQLLHDQNQIQSDRKRL